MMMMGSCPPEALEDSCMRMEGESEGANEQTTDAVGGAEEEREPTNKPRTQRGRESQQTNHGQLRLARPLRPWFVRWLSLSL